MKKQLFTIACLLLLKTGIQAQLNFAPAVNYGVGTNPTSVNTADFNNDGNPDIAVANLISSNISILLGSGTGTFSSAVNYGAGSGVRAVTSTDFNGDGNIDLAVANYNGNNISILLGSGTGTFGPPLNYGAGTNPTSVNSADFNGDGAADLAVCNLNSGNVTVLLGTGLGTFSSSVNYAVGSDPMCVISADFNGDSNKDLVVVNEVSNTISLLLGSGTGTFAPQVIFGTGTFPKEAISADFNGDGNADIAVTNASAGNVSIMLGTGLGTFTGFITYPSGTTARGITSDDFNGDGKLDLAVANQNANNLAILLGSGTGTFAAPVSYGVGTGTGPFSVAKADFDGDSKIDLAVCKYVSGNNVSVLLNTSIFPGARLNFDGVDDYVNIGNGINSVLDPINKFTAEAWVLPSSTVSPTFDAIVGNYNTSASGMQFLLRQTGNYYQFYIDAGTGFVAVNSAVGTVSVGVWQHVAGTWDGSALKLYINGVLTATNAAVGSSFITHTNPVWIGGQSINSEYFGGGIDEVRLWMRDLCQGEIANNFNGEIPTNSSGLIANYHFNQGNASQPNPTVTTLIDASSSAYTGTLTNMALTGTVSNWASPGAVNVNVTPFVSPTVAVNSGVICSGNSFTMVPSGVSTYTFSSGSAVVSPTVTTSYSVTGTNSLGCVASNTAVSSITVNASPAITVNSGVICIGNSFTMSPGGASTYTFSSGSAIVSPTANSSYSVSGTSTAGCVSFSPAVSNVTVNSLPTITVNSGTVCSGNSFTMTPGGASTYTFSSGSAVVSPTANSSYSVNGTDANGCVSASPAVSNVTVNAVPTVTVNSGAICSGNSFTMAPGGASTYTFSGGSAVVSPTANSSYSVNGTDANGCVSPSPAVSNVTVNPLPPVNASTSSTIICTLPTQQSAFLTANGANTYTWNPGGPGTSIIVSPSITTVYTVTGTDSNGCENTAVITQSVSTCAGITEYISGLGISVYPNPNSGIFNVYIQNVNDNTVISIINVIGQTVLKQEAKGEKTQINLQDLENGIYFISINHQDLKQIIKIVKQ